MKRLMIYLLCLAFSLISTKAFADPLKLKLHLRTVGLGSYLITGNVNGDFAKAEIVDNLTIVFQEDCSSRKITLKTEYGTFVSTAKASYPLRSLYGNLFNLLSAAYLELQKELGHQKAATFIGPLYSSGKRVMLIGASASATLSKKIPHGEYLLKIIGKNHGKIILEADGHVFVKPSCGFESLAI